MKSIEQPVGACHKSLLPLNNWQLVNGSGQVNSLEFAFSLTLPPYFSRVINLQVKFLYFNLKQAKWKQNRSKIEIFPKQNERKRNRRIVKETESLLHFGAASFNICQQLSFLLINDSSGEQRRESEFLKTSEARKRERDKNIQNK